jgi:hypothetical protein
MISAQPAAQALPERPESEHLQISNAHKLNKLTGKNVTDE